MVSIRTKKGASEMEKKTIVVIGATGSQGKGVVYALVNRGAFHVRAVTRNPRPIPDRLTKPSKLTSTILTH